MSMLAVVMLVVLALGLALNLATLGPRIPPAKEQADRLIQNATNNAATWEKNTLAPRKDPIDEAKKAAPKYEKNVQQAIAEKRFQKGLEHVDRGAMEETIKAVGGAGFAQGIANRRGKIEASREKLYDLQVEAVRALDAMPNNTEPDSIAKMTANMKAQKEIGRKYREK
jgi:hypothetical protein